MAKPTVSQEKSDEFNYSAAWTECGCLIGCWHHHRTVGEAVACIRSAGGYVVAVEGGAMRCLTAEEEAEFQYAVHPPCAKTVKPASPSFRDTAHGNLPRRGEGETLVEFVLRFLRAYGIDQDNERISNR